MSVRTHPSLPTGDSPERARAKETIWRLSALAFGHPVPEFHEALESGAFAHAFDAAWSAVTGRPWPAAPVSPDFVTLEAGYIRAFLHGPKGKPVAPILAGDHERLLRGLSRPVFMLNVSAFYRHFGLQAATGAEGRADEPDHLASMLEFMAVLASLEARALLKGRDPGPYRRAQRDFLRRYLGPLLHSVRRALADAEAVDLDPALRQLCAELAGWAEMEATELEARVGPFRDLDADPGAGPRTGQEAPRVVDQNLWA